MSFLKKLLGTRKPVIKTIQGLGDFTYYKNSQDEYWMIEQPVGRLPAEFDFGAIDGNESGPFPKALEVFKEIANSPEKLLPYIGDLFVEKVYPQLGMLSADDVASKFFLKSLTCSSKEKFEFGYHSREGDFFVESFYRSGQVTEVHLDEGCCE